MSAPYNDTPQHAPTPKELFLESLGRCTGNDSFIPAFYEKFLASNEEVRQKFRRTNFEQQNQMLLRSLQLAAGATIGEPQSLRELRARAESHDRYHLHIKPELYELWLEAALTTASEFDPQWNQDTESAWRSILGYVIDFMVKKF